MRTRWIVAAAVTLALCGCGKGSQRTAPTQAELRKCAEMIAHEAKNVQIGCMLGHPKSPAETARNTEALAKQVSEIERRKCPSGSTFSFDRHTFQGECVLTRTYLGVHSY